MAGVKLTRKSPFRVDDGPGDFRWFFTAEYPRLVRTLHGVVQDATLAEDIAQEAFIQLLNHWAKVSRYEQPGAWVRRVAIRMAVRELGRGRRRRELERSTLEGIFVESRIIMDVAGLLGQLGVLPAPEAA